jgi:hypothetical protein
VHFIHSAHGDHSSGSRIASRLGSCSPIGGSAGGCRSASWPDNPLGRWGVDGEQVGRADGTPDELAAAVRTAPVQDVLRAVAAPGALVRADEHVRGCRVEVPVAAFAIRPQLQHMTNINRQPRLEQASVAERYAKPAASAGSPFWGPARAALRGSVVQNRPSEHGLLSPCEWPVHRLRRACSFSKCDHDRGIQVHCDQAPVRVLRQRPLPLPRGIPWAWLEVAPFAADLALR